MVFLSVSAAWAVLSQLPPPGSPAVRCPAAFAQSRTVRIRCLTRLAVSDLVCQIGDSTARTSGDFNLVYPQVTDLGKSIPFERCDPLGRVLPVFPSRAVLLVDQGSCLRERRY